MRLTANIVVLSVILLSLLNIGGDNNLAIDMITTVAMFVAAGIYCKRIRHYFVLYVAIIASTYFWLHPNNTHFGDFSYVMVALSLYICLPTDAALLLLIKCVVNVPLRYIDPSLYWLAELADISVCLYLFYDIKEALSSYFPEYKHNDGHRKTGI